MLIAILEVQGKDEAGKGIDRENITKDLAEFVHPQQVEIKTEQFIAVECAG